MKKVLAFLLAALLALGCLTALADGEDEKYTYTIVYVDRSHPMEDDALNRWFCDRFNIEVEPIGMPWASIPENDSVMIMAGTMYDVMIINQKYEVIASYGAQDLLKPLPEGWEEKYPNIKLAIDATGVEDFFSADGKVYGIPGVNALHYSAGGLTLDVLGVYYRADWAEELGYHFDTVATVSEFAAFLKDCVDKDMAGNGQTRGMSSPYAARFFVDQYKPTMQMSEFVQVDGQYVWGPLVEGTIEGIKATKQYYQDGVIDPDYFTLDPFAGQNNLSAGLCAATYQTMSSANLKQMVENAAESGIENAIDKIKPLVVTDDNGVLHKAATTNLNWARVFSPEMTDDEFDRLLQLYDYIYSKEGNEVTMLGIPGVDWEYGENDMSYVNLMDLEEYPALTDKYSTRWFWRDVVHNTDFAPYNPATDPLYGKPVQMVKEAEFALALEGGYTPADLTVAFLDTPAKSDYSVDINAEVTRIVCDETISIDDVEAEWNKFISDNAALWQPVVDDLNATLN